MAKCSHIYEDDRVFDLNLTPLIDVSLVLVIIFMVTANFMATSSIKMDIPQAVHGEANAQGNDGVQISIDREGVVYWEKRVATLREIKEKLTLRHKSNPAVAVTLSADKHVEFNSVVAVIDIANGLGIEKINVLTEAVH